MNLLFRLRQGTIVTLALVVLIIEFSLFSGDNLVSDWVNLVGRGLGALGR